MRIATCKYNNQVHLAVVQDNSVFFPAISNDWSGEINSMQKLIDSGAESLQNLQKIVAQAGPDQWVSLAKVELMSPIPRPRQNIMCLG